MAENMTPALLPCPFCNSPAQLKESAGWHAAGCADLPCPGYQMGLTHTTPTKAATAWNTRPASPVSPLGAAPDGWKLVPTTPTLAMGWAYLEKAREASPMDDWKFSHPGYEAAIAAAPQAPIPATPAAPAAAMEPLAVRTAPKRIWLNLGDDADGNWDFEDLEEVTWSANNATGYGIEYVRAALSTQPAAEINPADFITEIIPGDRQKTIGFIHKIHSGVRLTHKPTGTTAESTTERSSHANRAIAWELMLAKLKEQPAAVAVGEREALINEVLGIADTYHATGGDLFRKSIESKLRAALATTPEVGPTIDSLADLIEGMSVSVDVSTGDNDAEHRYFGTVTEVMEDAESKHGITLLVQDAEPNFTPAKAEVQAEPVAWLYDGTLRSGSTTTSHRVITTEAKNCMPKKLVAEYSTPLYTSPQATQQDAIDAAKWRFVRASPDHAVCAMDRGHGWYAVTDAAIQAAQQGGSDA